MKGCGSSSGEFCQDQVEFDKAFVNCSEGAKTLELVDDEDILEAGIRIISQSRRAKNCRI